ncbi:hypothetical protein ACLOJK_004800, partial [Asimina triloba]
VRSVPMPHHRSTSRCLGSSGRIGGGVLQSAPCRRYGGRRGHSGEPWAPRRHPPHHEQHNPQAIQLPLYKILSKIRQHLP